MGLLHRLKPNSTPSTRLLIAACVWTAVGGGLLAAGVHWLILAEASWVAVGALVALLFGVAKGQLLLRARAKANAARIVAAGEARCVGGVFSWAMWGLVLSMMGLGLLLRLSSLPRFWLGVIYVSVGIALLTGSAAAWACWVEHRSAPRPEPGASP